MINVYRINYSSEALANSTFIAKGVINSNGDYINGTQSVVSMGQDTISGNFFYDIMTTDEIDFGPMINLLGTTTDHKFYGWN